MRYLSVADILGDSGAGSVSAAGSGLSLAERPSHLTHENWVLHNSLTVLEDPEGGTSGLLLEDGVRKATLCSRNIKGFTGDVMMMFSLALAIDLVTVCYNDESQVC